MIKYYISVLLVGLLFSIESNSITIDDETSVAQLEQQLGFDYSNKKPNMSVPGVSVEAGKALIFEGISVNEKGKKSKKQSKHFVCTSCHNTVNEEYDLANPNPEDRLNYAVENDIPFLQGTTLFGAVNRTSYYNGDYDKKYGDLVKPARHDIRGAIQLCAVECAQGRKLKDWEIESILAYLWTIDIKVKDLNLSSSELKDLNEEGKGNDEKLSLIKSKYTDKSEATFIPPPVDRRKGSGLQGDAANGSMIYQYSCLHCHQDGKYSYLHLDDSKMTRRYLKKNIAKYNNHSLYQVSRWGVPSYAGRKSYMPQYTQEKLSAQQLADLRAYLES